MCIYVQIEKRTDNVDGCVCVCCVRACMCCRQMEGKARSLGYSGDIKAYLAKGSS